MDVLITLVYLLFTICVVYPPSEFVSAGFTIAQLFDSYLGSENVNFVGYHMKRITVSVLIHSALPLGYVASLYCGGARGSWLLAGCAGAALLPLLAAYKLLCWWERRVTHPAVAPLLPYVTDGSDWRVVAAQLNTEFRSVDKVSLPLTATSKLIATETWLVKVTSYRLHIIKQSDCGLVATETDIPDLAASVEEETQYVNIQVVPSRDDILGFKFRITTQALRDLQPRLRQAVRVPAHVSLLPSLVERFVAVFNHHVAQNPVLELIEEPEACIGCMQAAADVALRRRCRAPPPAAARPSGPPECQLCNCRVLWCSSCMARWWAARASAAGTAPDQWLAARGSCPVCRAVCCLLDVCPARVRYSRVLRCSSCMARGSCPVCRAVCCLLDVCPARVRYSRVLRCSSCMARGSCPVCRAVCCLLDVCPARVRYSRVLRCSSCMARGSCPVCRAVCCLLDVCPARVRYSRVLRCSSCMARGSCPVCRAVCCLLDVCPARVRYSRVLRCSSCMARGSCPVCRAVCCLLDVCPARVRYSRVLRCSSCMARGSCPVCRAVCCLLDVCPARVRYSRVLRCSSCMARGSCPVCRAVCCLLDVCPARVRYSRVLRCSSCMRTEQFYE